MQAKNAARHASTGAVPEETGKTPVLAVILFTFLSGGIYFPVWFLTRRAGLNRLQSPEKLERGIFLLGIALFAVALALGIIAGVLEKLSPSPEPGFSLPALLGLTANLISLIAVIPLVYQTFKVKRILSDHFHGHLKRDIRFSNLMTLLFVNIYLQYKINRLEQEDKDHAHPALSN